MSGSYASIGCQAYEVYQPAPLLCFGSVWFGTFHVAELGSNRPAYFAHLLKLLRRKGRSREDAEDLIQEALLRLHVYADKEIYDREAFLRRSVHNLAIDQYRRDRSGLRCEVPIDEVDRQYPLTAPEPGPEQIVDSQQRLDQLVSRLDAVSQRTREIYVARRLGYTCAEIAQALGVAEITVKRHIGRALAALPRIRG